MATDANGNTIIAQPAGLLMNPAPAGQITTEPVPNPNTPTGPVSMTPVGNLSTTTQMPWDAGNSVTTPPSPAQASTGLLGAVNTATPATLNPNALSDQITKVTDPNSAISQRAEAEANEASNSKGLLNSSMAVGAARNAVLSAALPIAQGDVTAQEQTAQNAQQTELQNAQQKNAMETAQTQISTDVSKTNAAAANTQILAQLDQANKVQMAGINTKYQTLLNANTSASALQQSIITQIGAIQNNPNLDAAHKTDAISQQYAALDNALQSLQAISGLNLNLGFGGAATTTPATAPAGAPAGTTATPAANAQNAQDAQDAAAAAGNNNAYNGG